MRRLLFNLVFDGLDPILKQPRRVMQPSAVKILRIRDQMRDLVPDHLVLVGNLKISAISGASLDRRIFVFVQDLLRDLRWVWVLELKPLEPILVVVLPVEKAVRIQRTG